MTKGSNQMKNATVRLADVSKKYGAFTAVDTINLTIQPGEFVTLLGPSGCGKSTTLRMLGGFETPTTGRIYLGDEDVTSLPPNKRNVNMVFQDYALFPHMTSGQNIAFGLELKGMGKNDIQRKVDELLDFMQLGGFKDRKPDELSGGQRQRVALARALALDPGVLLLDEPLGALDAKLRKQVQIELKSIQKRTGKTFIFVTHDQEEALTMSDRVLVMNAGRIEQDGAPKDLYSHPESRFVADFIGETNILECTVTGSGDGQVMLDWAGAALRGTCSKGAPEKNQAVAAVIRPEDVTCYAAKPQEGGAMKARIIQRVFKGSVTTFELELDGGRKLTVAQNNINSEAIRDDTMWVGIDPAYLTVLLR